MWFLLNVKKPVRVTVNLCSVSLLFSLATPPARPTSETKTSAQPEPSDILTTPTAPSLQTGTFFFFHFGFLYSKHICLYSRCPFLPEHLLHRRPPLWILCSSQVSPQNLIQSSTNVVRNMKRSVRETDDLVVLFSFLVAFIMRGWNSVSQIFDNPEMTPRFLRQALFLWLVAVFLQASHVFPGLTKLLNVQKKILTIHTHCESSW